jgi:hypothetical protein
VDGASAPVVGLAAVRKTNPGSHAVVVKIGAREEKRAVELKEGEAREETVAMDGASAAAEVPGAKGGGGGEPRPSGGKDVHPLTWVGAGVAVAGLGVGAVAGFLALGKASDVKDACDGLVCPTRVQDDVDAGRTMATFSTVGFAVGGAGLALAAVGYFALSKPKSAAASPPVRVVAAPSWVGLGGAF